MALQQGEKFGCGTLRAIALLVLVRVRSSHTPSTRSPGPKVSTSPGCIAVRPQIGAGRSPATRENRRALPVRWRPPRAALRELRHLYQAAVRRDEARSDVLADLETAHGLEQQLTHALVECLGNARRSRSAGATKHRDVAARFEALLQDRPVPGLRTTDIRKLLDVSAPALRTACEEQLGMGPLAYIRYRSQQTNSVTAARQGV